MKRGDIYLVSLNPARAHGQQDHRRILVISPDDFNAATKLPAVLPITNGGNFARRQGFSVEIQGLKTTRIARCDQPRVLDMTARGGRKVDILPEELLNEVMAKVLTIFE